MLIIGSKEVEAGTVAVRRHGEGDRGAVPTAEFVESIRSEIDEQLGR
jgi:threonyl-tRNA synthetase